MKKHRLLYLAVTVAALIMYIVADCGEALAFLCVILIIPVVTFAMQCIAMGGIRINCKVIKSCRVGKILPITFTLERKSRLILGVVRAEAVFENLLFSESENIELNFQPEEDKRMTFTYLFYTKESGAVRFSVSGIECYDLLGLFRWYRSADIEEEIKVYPPELSLRAELSLRPESKEFGDLYDYNRRGQDVSEVAGLREYVSGDPVRSIHWKLSGKMGKMIVREFGYPSNYNTLILYEMTKNAGDRQISNKCNDAVLALTTSLSRSLIEMGLEHNVGRIYMRELQTIPVNSQSTYEQMADQLLYMQIPERENGINTAFLFLRGNFRNEYTKIIYITSVYDGEALKRISETADLIVIHVAEGKEIGYAKGLGYTVIPVDADTYQKSMHNIVL